MFKKFVKTIFLKEKKYFFFVFFAVFLSIFSYMLWNNVVLWVKNYLQEEIKPIVWADIVLQSEADIDLNFLNEKLDLFKTSKIIEINSTLFNENKPILFEFVYHQDNYPFYDTFSYDTINDDWKIVIDKETYDIFWDYIDIFWTDLKVKWVITDSPLWEISFYANNKKIYIPIDYFNNDLSEENSRIDFKILMNFLWEYDDNLVENIKDLASEKWYRVRTISDRQDAVWNITDRFYIFINFFNLIIFVLTFFIVILSLESFFKKNKKNFWLLNIFWLTKNKIFFYSLSSLFFVYIFSFLFAIVLNYIVIGFLSREFEFLIIYFDSIFRWFFILMVLLFVWVFSPFYKINKSSISSLLNDSSDFSNFTKKDYFLYIFLIYFGFFLINIISKISIFDSFIYSSVSIFLIIIFYLIIKYLLLFIYRKIFKKSKNFYLFDSIRSTIKPWNVSFLIIFSSIISFISIFIFFVFSWSFLNYLWVISKDSNDMFVLNVQNNHLETVEKYLSSDEIFEIVSLRIDKINGKKLSDFLWDENPSREFTREFNSTTNFLDNQIISWKELSSWWVSVDIEFANRLWISLWDKINFLVAWLEIELEVINFREAIRNWTNPFFFFMLDKSDFELFPKTYILSYKQSEKPENLESILSRETWWNLTFINTKDIIEIVVDISNKVLQVVYFALFYIFIFSFLSFIVSMIFLRSFKIYKIKLYNILWGSLKKLNIYLKLEYNYLMFIWLIFSLFFWSIVLFSIFYFIPFFDISYYYYYLSIWFLLSIYLFLTFVVYIYND